ncbi:hypothetical protein [Paenibacillus herberti]|uniref:Uncharacterized protein n=1 Tax=Paenibacillus herberti TaxID=1619309 RepID=A0A229NWR9_9BACL|nr:hypothetical protein [Paenibacillus herberti]OXM14340.1 hypothetical protein CGZ75_15435 [Paenibacillus herberti]
MKRAGMATGTVVLLLAAAIGSGTAYGAIDVKATMQKWYWDASDKKAEELRGGAEAEARESFQSAADSIVKEWQLTYGKQVDDATQLARQGAFDAYNNQYEIYLQGLDEAQAELAGGVGAQGSIESQFNEAVEAGRSQVDVELEEALDELLTEFVHKEKPPEPAE